MLTERKPKPTKPADKPAEIGAPAAAAGAGGRRDRGGDPARPRGARSRRGRDRRDHELHEHVEPERDDRRRPAGAEGRQARPDGEAVGEDQPRAGLEGRHRVLQAPPGCSSISTSSASTSSATAARPASATAVRCRTRCPKIVKDRNLVVASVLSGNRNFEGRIQPQVRANYLASPPLVVAYALAGRMQVDLTTEPLGHGSRRPAGVPQGHLADRARDPGDDAAAR